MSLRRIGAHITGLVAGIVVVSSAAVGLGADGGDALTVERAVEATLEREPFQTAQSAQLEALAGERRSAKAWPNPLLEVEREQQWEAGEAVAEDFFVLEQALPVWGTRSLRAEVVEWQMEAAKSANAAERLDERIAVERAFYETVKVRRELELARELRDQVAATVEVMEKRLKADEASQFEVARLRESLVEAKSTVAETRATLLEARGELASLVGRSATPLEAWSVRGELLPEALPELEPLVGRIDERPALLELEAEARAEARRRSALKRSLVPTPTVRGGYKRADDPTDGSFHGMMVGVSLDLPVFHQKSGERRAAAARETRLEAQATLRRRRAETRLRTAYRAAELRLESARRYRNRAVPRTEDLLERARQRQASGVGSLFGLVDAHRSVYETKVRAVERAWKARMAVIEVEQYAGGFP